MNGHFLHSSNGLQPGAISLDSSSSLCESFEIDGQDFLLNGSKFQIRSGELHFARIPFPYWRHRLEMARAMGLNTVCAYLFWNLHEPGQGTFYFEDQGDVVQFVTLAQEVGLKVILRPGPYACAEWDFGGLPAWLLASPDMRLRCSHPQFLEAARRYLIRVGQELATLQITQGGPIILVQVENEYGSYGNDKKYLAFIRDTLREAGFDVPFFTCDGPHALKRGGIEGAFPVANFDDSPTANFDILKKFSPDTPIACGEYYPGWFDHWGKQHNTRSSTALLTEVETMLSIAAMFSIYMFHGGTSFGFSAGANTDVDGTYQPQITSYDYDAPLDEAGRPTEKYFALRQLFHKYIGPEEMCESVPDALPVISIPAIHFSESAALLSHLPEPIFDITPRPMEFYGQNSGLILYRSTLCAGQETPLTIRELHDYGKVFVDGQLLATLDRRLNQNRVQIPARECESTIEILVEAMGRVNYGPYMLDRKGITQGVDFPTPYPAGTVMNWDVFPLPLDHDFVGSLNYSREVMDGPAFHRAYFELDVVGDTFLDLRHWGKGSVWVNGHNLGRFWSIGPQQTLFLPGCWLRVGHNEIVVFDLEAPSHRSVEGLKEPILDQLKNQLSD